MYRVENEASECKETKNSKQCLKQTQKTFKSRVGKNKTDVQTHKVTGPIFVVPCCCNKSPFEAHGGWSQAQKGQC